MKIYRAVVYISVVEDDEDGAATVAHISDYCAAAIVLDLDTEEYGNPYQISGITIDWDTLESALETSP